jgi:hypothetical protein
MHVARSVPEMTRTAPAGGPWLAAVTAELAGELRPEARRVQNRPCGL